MATAHESLAQRVLAQTSKGEQQHRPCVCEQCDDLKSEDFVCGSAATPLCPQVRCQRRAPAPRQPALLHHDEHEGRGHPNAWQCGRIAAALSWTCLRVTGGPEGRRLRLRHRQVPPRVTRRVARTCLQIVLPACLPRQAASSCGRPAAAAEAELASGGPQGPAVQASGPGGKGLVPPGQVLCPRGQEGQEGRVALRGGGRQVWHSMDAKRPRHTHGLVKTPGIVECDCFSSRCDHV
jgi:hypothetical protein